MKKTSIFLLLIIALSSYTIPTSFQDTEEYLDLDILCSEFLYDFAAYQSIIGGGYTDPTKKSEWVQIAVSDYCAPSASFGASFFPETVSVPVEFQSPVSATNYLTSIYKYHVGKSGARFSLKNVKIEKITKQNDAFLIAVTANQHIKGKIKVDGKFKNARREAPLRFLLALQTNGSLSLLGSQLQNVALSLEGEEVSSSAISSSIIQTSLHQMNVKRINLQKNMKSASEEARVYAEKQQAEEYQQYAQQYGYGVQVQYIDLTLSPDEKKEQNIQMKYIEDAKNFISSYSKLIRQNSTLASDQKLTYWRESVLQEKKIVENNVYLEDIQLLPIWHQLIEIQNQIQI